MTPAYEPGSEFNNHSGFERFLFVLITACFIVFSFLGTGFTLFTIIGLFLEQQSIVPLLLPILFMLMFCGFFILMMRQVLYVTLTRYRFEHEGLRIKRPMQRSRLIPWTDFQEVGVYFSDNHPDHLSKPGNISLCCIHKSARKNIYGHWSVIHTNKVFNMQYSPELHAGLCEMCTIPVKDLRLNYSPKPEKDPWR